MLVLIVVNEFITNNKNYMHRKLLQLIPLIATFASCSLSMAETNRIISCNVVKIIHCSVESNCLSVDQNALSKFNDYSLTFAIDQQLVFIDVQGQETQQIKISTLKHENNQTILRGQNRPDKDSKLVDHWTAVFTAEQKKATITISRGDLAAIIFAQCSKSNKI